MDFIQVLLYVLLIIVSGFALLFCLALFGFFDPRPQNKPFNAAEFIAKAAVWVWLLGLIYIGLAGKST